LEEHYKCFKIKRTSGMSAENFVFVFETA